MDAQDSPPLLPPGGPGGQSPKSGDGAEWECPKCTYLNPPARIACEICMGLRHNAPPTDPQASPSSLTCSHERAVCMLPRVNNSAYCEHHTCVCGENKSSKKLYCEGCEAIRQEAPGNTGQGHPVPGRGAIKDVLLRLHSALPSPASMRSASLRRDQFENDGARVRRIACPTERPPLSVEMALKEAGMKLGLWDVWGPEMVELWEIAEDRQVKGEGKSLAAVVGDSGMCSALTCYTSELPNVPPEDQIYTRLTGALRERLPEKIGVWEPFMYYLFNALRRLPNFEGTVYRGVKGPIKNQDDYIDGRKIYWCTLTSTSKVEAEAEKFLLKNMKDGEEGVFFKIRVNSATETKAFAEFTDEDEVLLPPNCELAVTGTREAKKPLSSGGAATIHFIDMLQLSEEVWG